MTLTPEILVPKLGQELVKQGSLTKDQLKVALAEQNRLREQGIQKPLGAILVEKGFISREILDQTVTSQILFYQNALKEANEQLEARVQERTQELERAYEQLSEFHILKSNFVASLSHELRTPLTHIKGYLDLYLLDQGFEISAELRSGLEVMQRSSVRLQGLIDDLILFSESEAGLMKLRNTSFDLQLAAESVILRNQGLANRKKIELKTSYLNPPFNVTADQRNITWVINQLVDNALKFTPEEGAVTIQLEHNDEFVTVKVKDTGIGFPEDKQKQIFEPFHQLDGSSKRKQGGIGLGLALTRNILEIHRSELKVISIPGKGSEFQFTLPTSAVND